MTAHEREEFDDLLDAPVESERRQVRRFGLLVSVASVALGGLVVAGTAFVATLPSGGSSATSAESSEPAAGAVGVVPPRTRATSAPKATVGVADLADEHAASELAARTGIPPRVLRAYLGAALQIAQEDPGCRLGWNTLAGIGAVESDHGTFGDSSIGDDGLTDPAIIGIALDGGDTAMIGDTDGGVLDGDAVWDRAVGPMQFIPGTWAQWGADGDGDGVADPQHIDDSALAAGRYLCAAGGDLADPQGWITAVAAYNDAVEYNNLVADAATSYANASG